jgi:hypothetical protein
MINKSLRACGALVCVLFSLTGCGGSSGSGGGVGNTPQSSNLTGIWSSASIFQGDEYGIDDQNMYSKFLIEDNGSDVKMHTCAGLGPFTYGKDEDVLIGPVIEGGSDDELVEAAMPNIEVISDNELAQLSSPFVSYFKVFDEPFVMDSQVSLRIGELVDAQDIYPECVSSTMLIRTTNDRQFIFRAINFVFSLNENEYSVEMNYPLSLIPGVYQLVWSDPDINQQAIAYVSYEGEDESISESFESPNLSPVIYDDYLGQTIEFYQLDDHQISGLIEMDVEDSDLNIVPVEISFDINFL